MPVALRANLLISSLTLVTLRGQVLRISEAT